jgi:hypothetical protein
MNVEKQKAAAVAPGVPVRAAQIGKKALILTYIRARTRERRRKRGMEAGDRDTHPRCFRGKCSEAIENKRVNFSSQPKCAQAYEIIEVIGRGTKSEGVAVRITISLYRTRYHKSKWLSEEFVLGIKWAQDSEGQKKSGFYHGDRGAEQAGRRKLGSRKEVKDRKTGTA